MTLEIIWPLKFVQVRKVAQVSVPANPAADPHTYPYGTISSSDSLPVEYWLIGWMLRSPVVGEPMRVLRFARNGIFMPGHFMTSDVMEIPVTGVFHTMNSVYHWDEIGGLFPASDANTNPEDL